MKTISHIIEDVLQHFDITGGSHRNMIATRIQGALKFGGYDIAPLTVSYQELLAAVRVADELAKAKGDRYGQLQTSQTEYTQHILDHLRVIANAKQSPLPDGPKQWTPIWKQGGRTYMTITFQPLPMSTMVAALCCDLFDEVRQVSPHSWEVRFK